MRARTRLIALPVVAVTAAALLWTSLGTLSVARAQKDSAISRAHTGDRAPSFDKPIYLLFLGSDARRGNPATARFDSIHVVAINPKTLKASIVGIPRDTWGPISSGGNAKILSVNGPGEMVKTIESRWGCKFQYYLMVGFQGYMGIIQTIGGVTVDVPVPLRETCCSKVNLRAGVQKLGGFQALAYARMRHGSNRPRGDLDRSQAQGDEMVGALSDARKALNKDVRIPLRSLAAMRRFVTMTIPLAEALRLGLLTLRIDPKNVYNTVADGKPGSEGTASVVHLSSAGNNTLFNVCAGRKIGP